MNCKRFIYKLLGLENKYLTELFNKRVLKIQEENSRKIINEKLIPYVITTTLANDKLLLTEEQAFVIATKMFLSAKEAGKIDELNCLVKESV